MNRKTAATLALCMSMSVGAFGQKQVIHLQRTKATVESFVKAIEKQTNMSVDFTQNALNLKRNVTVSSSKLTLAELLDEILRGQGLSYKIMDRHIAIVSKNGESRVAQQNSNKPAKYEVKGSIVDPNGEPIIGATIVEQGTNNRTITDIDGNFTLKTSAENPMLNVSYIGFTERQIKARAGQNMSIKMQENSQALSEVVVVGFGTQRKSNITDAITTVDTKMLSDRPVTNLSQSLQGTVPGLNLSVGGYGGQLGQSMNVAIRGTGTISTGSKAATLVLIDGIEGNMDDVNPDDIESISVLKDAAASSIYGSRAAFGVILITTKSGKADRTNVSYTGNVRYYGPGNLPNPMNSWEFANYFNDGCVNDGVTPIFNDDTLERIQKYMNGEINTTTIANANGNWQFHEKANDNVNWWKTHFKWSWAQEHNVNVNGGNAKNRYYVSANYLGQDGNLRYGDDKFKRLTTNFKYNATPYDWLDVQVNARYIYKNLDNPLYTDLGGLLYHDISRLWPMMPFKDPNGYYMRNGKLNQLTNGSRSETSTNDVYFQGQLVFHPLKNWNITGNVGLRSVNQFRKQNLNTVYEHNVKGEPLTLAYGSSYTTGQTAAMQYWLRSSMVTTNLYSDYSFAIDKHMFKLMAGMNTEKYNNRDLDVQRMDLITEMVPEIGGATGLDKIKDAGAYSWATVGFFGRLNYDYENRYFLTANIRYDGSSRFLSDDRWGLFGSVSMGWNIAAEKFFKVDERIISLLKPRVSWGTLGNQNTNSYYPFYLLQDVNAASGSWLMDGKKPTVASVPGTISNSLTWETVRSINVGFDLAMLNNRLTMNFDYYNRKTSNMVGPSGEIASVFGTTLPNSNNTDLHTRGWELAVNWQDYIGKVRYNVGFNISDARTFIDKYPNASKSLSTYYEGQELGEIWGYVTHGIAKSQEEMDSWLANNKPSWGSGWGEGDIMYEDLNGDKVINTGSNTLSDPGDRKVIGNSTPRYNFGVNMGLSWNGFDFSMFWQGVAKRDLWLTGNMFWGLNGGEWQSTGFKEHLDYYRPENTTSVFGPNTNAYFPRIYMNSDKNQYTQTRYLQNGAYARLKNIQLGYTLPKFLTNRIGLQKVYLYVSAENLLTISSLLDSFDPETAYSNYSEANTGKAYPLQKTVSFGLNVSF